MKLLSLHAHTALQALRRLAEAPWSNALAVLVIGVTLSLPAGLYALVDNLRHLAGNIPNEPEITLFLAKDAGKSDIARVEEQLRKHTGLSGHRFAPRDQALKELAKQAGLEDLAGALENNPLPDAFILRPAAEEPEALEALRQEMAEWPKVETVQMDAAWVRKLHALLEVGRHSAAVLGGLLAVALLAIIGNTIRLQILTRREEIEVASLIGATDDFIRRPFLYFGALQGLLGGITAWLLVSASLLVLGGGMSRFAALYGLELGLHPLGPAPTFILLALSTLLGWVAAYTAVNRHLREQAH